jgi:hypothetical protein
MPPIMRRSEYGRAAVRGRAQLAQTNIGGFTKCISG